jgi:hypothetical protein
MLVFIKKYHKKPVMELKLNYRIKNKKNDAWNEITSSSSID